MRSGNLYTKLQNAGKKVGRQGRYVTCLLAGLLLFSVHSIAQLNFDNGSPQSASYCINSANSINNLLKATDATGGLTLTWTVFSGPTNGTLGGFPFATLSVAATSVTPSGLSYSPTASFTGSDAFTIQVSDGTNTALTTINVTVVDNPDVSNFSTSATNPCQGAGSTVTINSTSLAAGTYNVTYNLSGANSATGVIGSVTMAANTGNFVTSSLASSGATTIVITSITNATGCTSTVSSGNVAGFTVNANPSAIFVPGSVCVGSTMTVTSGTAGGTWTSSNTGLATVVAATGVVTGIGAGNPTISYTLGTGCFTTATITVNPSPNAITGSNTVCTGTTTALTETTAGGTWSSSNAGVASVSVTGVVTGVTAGTPTISYTLPAGCFTLFPMTVNTTPAANTGTPVVCTGLTTILANGTGGGLWSSSNTGLATVGAGTGAVSGVSAGTPDITYTVPSGCFAVTNVTVNTSPAAIAGANSVCVGATTTLTNSTGGGTWTSSNTLLATVGSSTGLVTGVAAGTPTITYTMPDACFETLPITVNSNPAVITGAPFMVCTGSTITLADGTGGGTWSSSNAGIATAGAGTGVVTGIASGIATISYTLGTSCFAVQDVTVNTAPAANGGASTVCVGSTTTLTNSSGGGSWSTANPAIATVGAGTGIVTGVAAGTVNISYILPSGCYAITSMTVGPVPAAIGGTFTVCVGTSTTLTDATPAGVWSSSDNSLATVGGGTGVVTGVAGGTPTISYTVSGCSATQVVTVNSTPAGIGGPTSVCEGSSITLTDATGGGLWSSSSTGLATVGSSTGTVTGVAAGTPTITYTLPTGCVATLDITVNPTPTAIAGSGTVCTGANTTLTDATVGGAWSSSDITTATIGAGSGIVTGVNAGNVTMTYTMATSCFVTFDMTVNPSPAAITGTATVCEGLTTTLSDATASGVWSSSNTALATVGAVSGIVTGVAGGVPTISYTVATGCFATIPVTVNALPAAIGGTAEVCVGSTTTLTDATTGGTWSSSNVAQATIGAVTGIMTGVAAGNPTITYTTAAGCIATVTATIDPLPAAIAGTMSVCEGSATTLTDADPGGIWSSSNASLATAGAFSGVITGVAAGVPTITYVLPTGCYSTTPVTVNPNPAAITGTANVCEGATTTLFDATSGGTWTSSNITFATVDAVTGVVTGVASGTPTITYTLPTGCFMTQAVTVNPNPAGITGTATVCEGLTTTLANATAGGTWSSSNTGEATVVAGTGVVTGVAAGNPIISYTLATGCYATIVVTVNANPSAITGTTTVCVGATTTLSSSPAGGLWSSSDISEATAGAGVITGTGAGTPTITYTLPTGCIATQGIIVNPTPAAIAGTTSVCVGATTTLSDATPGGTWSSSNAGQASVVAGTGVVTGVTAGTPVISYTLGTGCYNTIIVTVNDNPAAITGAASVCTGATIGLSDATTGGLWSSSDITMATAGSTTGVVTGIAAGSPTISYTLPTGCFATYAINVNTTPAAITGTMTVCTGLTTTLADATAGGTWSSSNTSEATVGAATGVVTGVAAGTPIISYVMGTGCYATAAVTVNQTPAAITGTPAVCVGSTTALNDADAGGTWSSSDNSLATVGAATGIVTGVAIGTPVITYTMPTGCMAVQQITVNPTPASVTGAAIVCAGSNITLSDATSGGVWSSGNTGIATVGAGTGIVTGVAGGVVTITYSLGAGCYATTIVTVNPTPDISNYTATSATSPCVGNSSNVTISSTSLGSGTFTVTYNLSGANAVTGATATLTMGSTTGTFTIPSASLTSTGFTTVTVTMITNSFGCNSFPTSSNTSTFSVNALPTVYNVTGGGSYCSGGSGVHVFLSNSVGGVNYQLWLGATAVGAPVAGTFSGLDFGTFTTAGTYTVTATNTTTGCGDNMSGSATISINPLPNGTFTVTGGGSYCSGGSGVAVGLSSSQASVNYQLYIGGVATGSPVGGTGSPISFGLQTAAGTYTVVATDAVTGCTNPETGSVAVVINPLPSAITGTMTVCPGLTTTLSDATAGGTWSSSTPTNATVGATTGVVTGVLAGTSIITYTLSTGCIVTATVTVNPNPAGIAGATSVCEGQATTLTDATGGGTWSSSNSSLATINVLSGIVTGVAAGTPTMTYTLATGCYVVFPMTVNPTPAAIGGATNVCEGLTTTLTDATSGGTWSSSAPGTASVVAGTGVVTGAGAGTATITYTLPAGCSVTTSFTVNPTPASITGTATVCEGSTTALADASGGGTWSSSNPSVASVVAGTGVVSGVAAGTVTITYTLPAGCFTTTLVTVNPTPAAITGTNNICFGASTTLSDATSGGTWSSSNPSNASVGAATGIISGAGVGTATITYTLPAGCTATYAVTVNPNPAAITGVTNVCIGSTTTLGDATSGGVWSSSNATLASVVAGTGVVTGVNAGVPNISYTLPTGCFAVTPVTVNPLPAGITGVTTVCSGATTTLSDASAGGAWSSSDPSTASVVSGTGVVTGGTAGTATITYTLPTGCITTTGVTVNPSPAAITGPGFVCLGSTVTLSDATGGGTWSSSNPSLASVVAGTGVVTGNAIGVPTITYTLPAGCFATMAISVNPVPASITGTMTVCEGSTTTLADGVGGGAWSSSNTAVGTVNAATGVVSGIAAGTTNITYTLPGGCFTTAVVTVNPSPAAIGGANNVCAGSTTTLTNSVAGGLWTSSNTALATIGSATGVVSGLVAGALTITYTLPAGCFTTTAFTVNPLPASITGVASVCVGLTTTLSDASGGGTWSSSNTSVGTVGAATGVVTGISAGTTTITYTLPTTCFITTTVTVNPLPTAYAVTGGGAYCTGGSGVTIGLANSQSGVNYQLFNGVTSVGSPVAGTGSAISFGLQTGSGTYTVVATNTTTSCTSNMTGSATVIINLNPTVFNMTGGGSYCSGGTGDSVGLNGSQSGVNYQIYNGFTPIGAPITGTGAAISWGLITSAGTYTVIATNISTGCTSNMTGASVIVINPLPTAFTVTGGGAVCSGGTGAHIGLSGSQTGVTYTVSGPATATIAGTGGAIDFGTFAIGGTYTVSAQSTSSLCTNTMTGSVTVSVNALPTVNTVTRSAAAYCAGGAGVTINQNNSQTGINYQLMLNGSPVGSTIPGFTGSTLSYGSQTGVGTYTAIATNTITGCTVNMLTSPSPLTVTTNPLPSTTGISVGGGGGYCSGGTGSVITLSGSVSGTSYTLYRGSTIVGSAIAGTGSSLSFPAQTSIGTYTVVGSTAYTVPASLTCTVNMPGSTAISIYALPNAYSVIGGGNYCAGSTGVTVGMFTSDIGTNYQLYLNAITAVGTPVAGTGASFNFGTFTAAGLYTVQAINPATGCTNNMLSSATVAINALPTAYPVSGGGSYCAGSTGVSITVGGSQVGVSYQLKLAGGNVGSPILGTGALSFSFPPATLGGTYTVVATNVTTGCVNNMSGSAVVAINPVPTVFNVSGTGSYCAGGAGVHVFLSGSASGINYQLLLGNTTPVGTPVAGTGSSLDFGAQTTGGVYRVTATNTLTGCIDTMSSSDTVTVNALPLTHTVTGGGAYCTGGSGVPVGLATSGNGISYQLILNGTTPLGAPVTGTGGAVSFGPQTTAGTYTVVGTNTITGCTNTMTGSAVVTVNPLPAVFTVTGGGQYCPGGSGVTIGLGGSVVGVNYQLSMAGSPLGPVVAGTGANIDFGSQTGIGTYTVNATDASTGCTSVMTGTAVVSLFALPTAFNVTGGGGYCTGGTGANVMLSNSTTGVNYQLYVGSTPVGSATAGTGALLNFGPQTAIGTYTVQAMSTISGCSNNMAGSVTVSLNPLPTGYNVTGGGGYCAGGTGVAVGLNGSDAAITYQLVRGTTNVGSPLAGTGSALDFGLQTIAGAYTISATNVVTGCVSAMTGSASVMINALPIVYAVTGGGNYCAGGTGVSVGLMTSDMGVNYQLMNGTTAVDVPMAGSGSALDFGSQTAAGTYTIVATDALTGCTSTMSGSATVVVNLLPAAFTVTGGGNYCAGGTGIHVGLGGSAAGISYQLMNGSTATGLAMAGTGGSLDFGLQTAAGTYTVAATNSSTGCTSNMTGSATVVVNPLPVVDTVTGGGDYCPGGTGVHVGLNTSSNGINYQLMRGTTVLGLPVPGTGSGLDFGLQTIAGTYFVVAADPATGCTANMSGSAAVNISALPTAFTLAGASPAYCAGGTGVHLTLGGSSVGTNYQLYIGSLTLGTPVAGTGLPIDFGAQTSAGTYSVVATSTVTGCVNNMTGTPAIAISPLPLLFTVSGGGSYCAGGTGQHVFQSGSEVGVNYQLMSGSATVGGVVAGTGFSLDFGSHTGAGTYTVVATNATTGCTNTMLSSATISVNPLPNTWFVVGGGNYCAGGTGVFVGLSGSDAGISYQLFNGTAVGGPIAGSGAAFNFGAQTVAGTYTVVAANTVTGCTSNMTSSATVAVNALPAVFAVTGGGNYCIGGSGVHIGLSGSAASGINYQLMNGVTPIGSVIAGTGGPLDFGLVTVAATYTVKATNAATGCDATMGGSAIVTVSSLPTVYNVTGGGSYCASTAGAGVSLNNSDAGINYQLYNGSAPVGAAIPGVTGTLDFGLQPAGTYTVVGINATTGCTNNMAGSVTVTMMPSVTPSVTISTGMGDTVCAGSTIVFTPLTVNGGGAPTFQWFVNGTPVGTSGSYSYIPLNGDIVSVTMTSNATCVLPATASNAITMTVNANVTPMVSITVSPNDTICQGTVVTFTPTAVYGGSTPVYAWFVNGSNRATGSTYAYAPNDGDVVFAQLTSSYACVLTNTALSNNITFHVDDNTLPVVSVTVNTGANVGGVVYNDTMTAIVTNGAVDQKYQWSVNGVPVNGATNANYIAAQLNNGDAVSCVVTKINACGVLFGSGVAIINSSNVGVQPVVVTTGDVRLVPNPNKGLFTLKGSLGTTGDEEVSVEVTDMIGQVVYRATAIAHNGIVDETIKLNSVANGMYMVNFHAGTESKVFHMVVEQ